MRHRFDPFVAVLLGVLALLFAGSKWIQGARRPADAPPPYESLAKYKTEAEAVGVARRLDPGTARLEGPQRIVVDTFGSWTLVFTVGKAGMKPGGGIRLAFAHGMGSNWGVYRLQTDKPRGENFVTASTPDGATIEIRPAGAKGVRTRFFRQYHPWQYINEFILRDKALKPGDEIRIAVGDRRGGGAGCRVQTTSEKAFVFKLYVDAVGNDDYLPLPEHPTVEIAAEPAKHLNVIVPSTITLNQPAWVAVWAMDRFGNPAGGYEGTVAFNGDNLPQGLPKQYTFRPEDRSAHRFENVTWTKGDIVRVSAHDRDADIRADSNPGQCHAAAPEEQVLWGDIHVHTKGSDGRGTVAEAYDYGKRVAALDFAAVSDHAFTVPDAGWELNKRITNEYYEPGRYVTIHAFEWSGQSNVGGDHNVYYRDGDPPIFRSKSYYTYNNLRMYHGPKPQVNHVETLFKVLNDYCTDENVLTIPHYGGRQGNPDWHNPRIQRMIEVFSDHRRSEDWMTPFLTAGYRIGIMASTDNHASRTGFGFRRHKAKGIGPEISTSLVAVFAGQRTRDSVFAGLYNRRVYATSGERIILHMDVDGHPMGTEFKSNTPPRIKVTAVGTAPIKQIEIKKNSKVIFTKPCETRRETFEYLDRSKEYENVYYYVRVVQEDGEEAISSPVWMN